MKILVTLKRVPDPEQKVKFKGSELDLSQASWVLNTFDEYAVETALRLNENAGSGEKLGEVVVASIGPKESSQQLRSALAMGADRAILVGGDDAQLDSWAVAKVVQKLVEQEKPDVVIMGKQTPDGESNQAGQILAGLLGWPQACFAGSVQKQDATLVVGREVDAGIESKQVPLPAVVTVDLRVILPNAVKNGVTPDSHKYEEGPRYASLKGIMAAKKKELKEVALASLGVDATPRVKYTSMEAPPARKAGVKVKDVQELVGKLHNEAKVI